MGLNEGRRLVSADTFRQLSTAYPDDPSIWYQLGETVFHSYIPRGWPEAEKAFSRAAELDPGMTPYHHHLVDLAFSLHRDSALSARRIEAHPPGKRKPMYRLAMNLVFGNSVQRREALSRLDTISVPGSWLALNPLEHPKDLTLQDTVLRKLLNREDLNDPSYARNLLINDVERGQVDRLLSDLGRVKTKPGFVANLLALSMSQGMPVPESVARHYLAPENLPTEPSLIYLQSVGIYLIEQGREDELNRIIRRVRAAGTGRSQSSSGETVAATVREIKGYRAFKADSLKEAVRLWGRWKASPPPGGIWRGDLYRRLGRLKEAEGWYLAAWPVPLAHERLGQLYEEMDKPEEARAAYERFIEAWKNADPELQDRVTKARERLEALGENKSAE